MLWKRFRRRSMAPGRPAVYPHQVGLLAVTLVTIAAGMYAALRFLL